eukprot:TRINITY_DN5002_c0_g1_i2.p1 TRINITY_DN5002_c0_g1~~TRINITY_DN5002_c0_g1_i2.p1  ORF type:complete len:626 (-),score=175.22 TRINITY_DN5002_c0_g1_i2:28-1905(-)
MLSMSGKTSKTIRIGCSSAFWGDTPSAAHQLVTMGGHLDYLVSDYLAEVTMCILARAKSKGASGGAGEGGYVREYVDTVWKPLMKQIMDRNIKLVTNAGGMNPLALKLAIEQAAKEANLPIPIVAAIHGDDLTDKIHDLKEEGKLEPFTLVNEKEELWKDGVPIMSVNAYIGALPIVEALQNGAQIIVTGRCVDSALVLGPLIHEFKWNFNDFDLLSAGSLAGHIIECGCQATGGNFTDWRESLAGGWTNVGFPIVECNVDGSFVVTKPENTGGIVTVGTVSEQMLYEIGDPKAYILPDVVCDWSQVEINQLAKNRVSVRGARGNSPTNTYKLSVTTLGGFKMGGSLMIGGVDAAEKARAVGESVLERTRQLLKKRGLDDFIDTNIELLGAEHTYGPNSKVKNTREVVLRVVATHKSDRALGLFAKEMAPSATSMAPGITGSSDGRPHPTPLIGYFSCLLDKKHVPITVSVGPDYHSSKIILAPIGSSSSKDKSEKKSKEIPTPKLSGKTIKAPLITLALGRSGDKGDAANIGLIARRPEYYDWIKKEITEEVVKSYMGHLIKGTVKRFEVPGINGLNFILTKSLGGGGVSSLYMDRQGKTYAQMLLTIEIPIPIEWSSSPLAKL